MVEPKKKGKSRGQRLRAAGFDYSEYSPSTKTWTVKCSQCEALVINGVACHETGCPNERRSRE